jgi:hypothetical protein
MFHFTCLLILRYKQPQRSTTTQQNKRWCMHHPHQKSNETARGASGQCGYAPNDGSEMDADRPLLCSAVATTRCMISTTAVTHADTDLTWLVEALLKCTRSGQGVDWVHAERVHTEPKDPGLGYPQCTLGLPASLEQRALIPTGSSVPFWKSLWTLDTLD